MTNRKLRVGDRVKGVAYTCIGEVGIIFNIVSLGGSKERKRFYAVSFDGREELVLKVRGGLELV